MGLITKDLLRRRVLNVRNFSCIFTCNRRRKTYHIIFNPCNLLIKHLQNAKPITAGVNGQVSFGVGASKITFIKKTCKISGNIGAYWFDYWQAIPVIN